MLTAPMMKLISTYTIGCIATVRPDGAPAVSPKGTFLVLDARTLAFANIRSEGTIANIHHEARVEINFVDEFARKGCRVRGKARYLTADRAASEDVEKFRAKWPELSALIKGIAVIEVAEAELLTSPAYDVGADQAQLERHWLALYAAGLGYDVVENSGRPVAATS